MQTCRFAAVTLLLAVALCAAAVPSAPGSSPREDSPSYKWGFKGGIGFTADPDAFLMGLEGDYAFLREFRVGPLLQIATADHVTIVAPTVNAKFFVPMPKEPQGLDRLQPFLQGGIGFAYVEKERYRHHDDDDVGFLMNAGLGCDYMLTDRFGLGTSLLFNVLPDKTVGERFFFSWQVVTASIRF